MLGVKLPDIYSKAFFRQEVVEHTSSWHETVIRCGEQEPCVEGALQVS